MTNKINSKRFKKIAFAASLCLFILWGILGTGTSLAWFRDTSNELKNIFHVSDFDVQVFRRFEDGTWDNDEVEASTSLFNENALYEPGYVQTVVLKVKNNGDLPFNWETAVSVFDYTSGINFKGDSFDLQDFLKFGVVFADTEAELDALISTREKAIAASNEDLGTYSVNRPTLDAGEETFLALTVRMPEEVSNEANYVPPHQPEVILRVIVSATKTN